MSVRETLDKIEDLVAGSFHIPIYGKTAIRDDVLIQYIEDLRNDLPKELNRADQIMKDRDNIIANAKREAEEIHKEAEEYARRITEQDEIVKRARTQGKSILQKAQDDAKDRAKEIVAQAQAEAQRQREEASAYADQVTAYADQVFGQLIKHVDKTYKISQQSRQEAVNAEKGLQQALLILQQARVQLAASQSSSASVEEQPAPQQEEAPTEQPAEAQQDRAER